METSGWETAKQKKFPPPKQTLKVRLRVRPFSEIIRRPEDQGDHVCTLDTWTSLTRGGSSVVLVTVRVMIRGVRCAMVWVYTPKIFSWITSIATQRIRSWFGGVWTLPLVALQKEFQRSVDQSYCATSLNYGLLLQLHKIFVVENFYSKNNNKKNCIIDWRIFELLISSKSWVLKSKVKELFIMRKLFKKNYGNIYIIKNIFKFRKYNLANFRIHFFSKFIYYFKLVFELENKLTGIRIII